MTLIDDALTKLYAIADAKLDEDIVISFPGQSGFALRATVTQATELTDSGKVKVQSKRFHFLIDTADLEETNLPLNRGLSIVRVLKNRSYELIFDKSGAFKYNDPDHRRIVLIANEVDKC